MLAAVLALVSLGTAIVSLLRAENALGKLEGHAANLARNNQLLDNHIATQAAHTTPQGRKTDATG